MVSFSGWEMPIQFSGLIKEHQAVRSNAGLFDISHMGSLLIKGSNAKDQMQSLVPSDLQRIGVGESCYTVLLNKNGGIIDDLIIYDLGLDNENQESLLAIVNAACLDIDKQWIQENLSQSISIKNAKKNPILLAIQGPKAKEYLEKYLKISLSSLPKFGHKTIEIKNLHEKACSIFIARTGYTGEDGFEILLDEYPGKEFWKGLISLGVIPCGLGARDTLRLEAGLSLYGVDLNVETTPFEAGLGWLVNLEMPKNFIGRKFLEKQCKEGIQKKLVGIEMKGRAIARTGYEMLYKNKPIGKITSGTWSPTLKKGIALAYLPQEFTKIGTPINVKIREDIHEACVVKKPFYRRVS